MSLRILLVNLMAGLMVPLLFASLASAQAGLACGGGGLAPTQCGLGGQIRGQIGDGVPLPISKAPGQGASGPWPGILGPFTAITIRTVPGARGVTPFGLPISIFVSPTGFLPYVGQGLGQTGQIKPIPFATVMQTTGPAPRALTLAPGAFRYGNQPQGSIGVVNFNIAVFAVQTNLEYDTPHPGTTKSGAAALTFSGGAIPTPSANVLSMGGRKGAATLTYYANATTLGPGSPSNNFGSQSPTPIAGEAGADNINGVARFTATGNQFGGQVIGRATGTARVYFNSVPLVPATDLPCKVTATPLEGTTAIGFFVPFNTGTDCQFGLSIVDLTLSKATVGVSGGAFGGFTSRSAVTPNKGLFTGTIGFNGTFIGQNNRVTALGVNVPFTALGNGIGANFPVNSEASRAVGFPLTTGRLSITVTDVVGTTSERFIRTGIDARDANGNGVVALVTGSLTARNISGGHANRTWITLEIPEPSAILAASAGLLTLFGCHRGNGNRRKQAPLQHVRK